MMSKQHDKDKASWQRKNSKTEAKQKQSNMTVAKLAAYMGKAMSQRKSCIMESKQHDSGKAV